MVDLDQNFFYHILTPPKGLQACIDNFGIGSFFEPWEAQNPNFRGHIAEGLENFALPGFFSLAASKYLRTCTLSSKNKILMHYTFGGDRAIIFGAKSSY